MGRLPNLIEKTYFYPLNYRSAAHAETVHVQARGDGLYPLIKDGDILWIEQAGHSDLRTADLVLLEGPSGQLAVRCVLIKKRRLNGYAGSVQSNRLVGRVVAIKRNGRTKTFNDQLARLSHIIYFCSRPLIRMVLVIRRVILLLHPKFFVKDPKSSLHCVAEKFNDVDEVLYYSQRAFEGLGEEERFLVERFMKRRGRVLNIGCGAGREAFALAKLGFDVVGIDVASQMIEEARRYAQGFGKNIQFEITSGTALDYPSRSFDYVLVSAGVYSHIPTRQLRIDTLKKINDLLTPNGILFFSVLYRPGTFFSRISLYDMLRMIAKPVLKKRLQSEPGDMLVRYVSPIGTPSKLCYVHFFKDPSEILEEITLADLDGFEDEKSGYWIVRRQRNGTRHEVAS